MPLQIDLDFEPGLTQRFRSLTEVCAAAVYSSRGGLGAIASELDMSPSELSKRLNVDKAATDPRPLHADHVAAIVKATGDQRPVLYLVEMFCTDREMQRRAALNSLSKLLPEIHGLVKTLKE